MPSTLSTLRVLHVIPSLGRLCLIAPSSGRPDTEHDGALEFGGSSGGGQSDGLGKGLVLESAGLVQYLSENIPLTS